MMGVEPYEGNVECLLQNQPMRCLIFSLAHGKTGEGNEVLPVVIGRNKHHMFCGQSWLAMYSFAAFFNISSHILGMYVLSSAMVKVCVSFVFYMTDGSEALPGIGLPRVDQGRNAYYDMHVRIVVTC